MYYKDKKEQIYSSYFKATNKIKQFTDVMGINSKASDTPLQCDVFNCYIFATNKTLQHLFLLETLVTVQA